jgi:shikimate O-hydroxycinnamoyltransferase
VVQEDTSPQTEQSVKSIVKIFRFSVDELERMKREATAHLLPDMDHVSTFDVLAAHLYRHVVLARDSSHSYISKLYIPVNIRSRLKQPIIPSTYFGNTVLHTYLETESTDLIRINDLGFWARQVHQAVATLTSDEIKSTLAWIIAQPDKSKIMFNFPFDDTGFYITAWNKMGMYVNSDFEHGVHSCRITLPFEEIFNGGAYFFSTEKNDTSIDVILILDSTAMEKLENNPDFRKYC